MTIYYSHIVLVLLICLDDVISLVQTNAKRKIEKHESCA